MHTYRTTSRYNSWSSPIFWRITGIVFLSIIIIEAILLVFSWHRERDRQLNRIDDSFAIISTISNTRQIVPILDSLLTQPGGTSTPVIGYVIKRGTRIQSQSGSTVGLGGNEMPSQNHLNTAAWVYDTRVIAPDNPESVELWLRVDVSIVNQILDQYVLKLLGMILIISLFVTAVCLLFLTPLLVRPLQRLNQLLLLTGQSNSLENQEIQSGDLTRSDELGTVFRSFDNLREQLAKAESENVEINERFRHFANLGADCFWEVDREQRLTYIAGDVLEMFGVEPEHLLGIPIEEILNSIPTDLPDPSVIISSLREDGTWEGELSKSLNRERSIRIVANGLYRNSHLTGARGTVVDITAATEMARILTYQANHDALTGLYNRREFDRLLADALAAWQQEGKIFCICMIDLDRFKLVNDNCGHSAGDSLLKQLADLISASVHATDAVARFGGDEFTVLMRDCSIEKGTRAANAIRLAVEKYRFPWNEKIFEIGASIGIADSSSAPDNGRDILTAADACCIKAKNMGRNQVQAYSPTDESVVRHYGEMHWMARITQALREDMFLLYHQFIVPVTDDGNDDYHFEILLRMKGTDGSIYSPAEFLPAAERYNLIEKIDKHVCELTMQWISNQTVDITDKLLVNINLSAISLSDDDFQKYLVDRISKLQVDARHLCFELTESTAMKNRQKTIEFFKQLRSLGCSIALDDFGSGFSSMVQLHSLPIDYIKIDGGLIRNLPESEINKALVKSVCEVGEILNVKTVAEFVEDEQTLIVLKELGVDYAQGYLFSRPSQLPDLLFNDHQQAAA